MGAAQEHVVGRGFTQEVTGTAAARIHQPRTLLHPVFTQPLSSRRYFCLHSLVCIAVTQSLNNHFFFFFSLLDLLG